MPRNKNQSRGARILLALSVVLFVFTATARPAHAILGIGDVSVTVGDVPRILESVYDRIKQAVGSRAFHQAVRSVTYRLAQDSAVWLASGDKGKKPLVFQQPLGDVLTDIGDEVAGKFLVNMSQSLPINLCSPSSVQSRLKLTIGVSKSIQDIDLFPDRPDRAVSGDLGKTGCNLSDIAGNFGSAIANQKQAFKNLSKGFDIDNNELGAFLVLRENVQKEKKKKEEQEKIERAGEAPKAVKDLITGVTVTPAFQVTETQKQATKKALEQDVQPTGDILADAAAIFANTFAKTYLQRLQRGLLRGSIARKGGRGPGGLGSTAAVNQASFKNVFGSPPTFGISGGAVNLISDMSICPTSQDPNVYQSPYNCLLSDGLKQAVEQKLTVRQAMDQGMIPGDTLFPQTHVASAPNLSEENLKRLRFLRVIPLGWELAAGRLGSKTVPFRTLLDCFDAPDDTQGCTGNAGQENILRRLVDPSWVLALPQAECRALAYSSLPEYVQSPNRQSVCVDLASCLSEDANGNCTGGFGYCTRERVTWQLTGQSCEPQYATCQSFTSPKPLNVLTAYVDNEGCNEQTAGCKWYSTARQDPDVADSWNQAAKIYLNNNAQSCGASQAGSREVVPLVPGVNYIKNAGFDEELFSSRPSGIGTIGDPVPPAPEEGGWDFHGQDLAGENGAYIAGAGAIVPIDASQEITIKPYTYYTLSFFAFPNPNDANIDDATVEVSASGPLKSVSFPDYSFAESNTLTLGVPDFALYSSARFAATFYSANETNIAIHLKDQALYDDVQLEEVKLQQGADAIAAVSTATPKGPGILNTVPGSGSINVASPTTAYKPYGTENKSVFAAASECTADETSARAYTPLSGGSTKYARLTANGLCSSQCNGFDTLLAMPTAIEKLVTPNARPARVQFIPSLGQSCTAAAVGCEAFTNVATEARQYFNRIESCVASENPNTATFFTWEAGQLATWQLLKDANSNGPCTAFPQGGRAGQINPATASCQDSAGGSPVCSNSEESTLCRTFLDENGVEYYRDSNKVITASGQCTEFRRTVEVSGVQESWYFIPSEANQCSSAAVGCREYKGTQANVVQGVYFEDFENGTGGWSGGGLSNESVEQNQASYRITAGEGRDIIRVIALPNPINKTYELRFRAKTAADGTAASFDLMRLRTEDASGQQNRYFLHNTDDRPITVSGTWREYRAGPLNYQPLGGSHDTQDPGLYIRAQGSDIVIDNIEIVQVPDTYYRIQQSTLPVREGGSQPNACFDAGIRSCRAYGDDKNNTYYVSEFDKLFATVRSLTCTAVIDTQNSDYPYSQAFSMGTAASPDWHPVPADRVNYRYIDPANKVEASAAGCTALGSPPIGTDPNGPVAGWSTAYKRIDPDEFAGPSGTLCNQGGLWCEAFAAQSGGTYYFRDPGDKLCVWNPDAPNTNGLGGFVMPNDSATLCDTNGGYVPQCPSQANSCTAYQPTRSDLSEGTATTLFRIADEVSAGNCTGQSIEAGCVEFNTGHFTSASSQYDPAAIPKSKFSAGTSPSVLSVTQARQCAEWLAPTTTSQAKEPATGAARTVTYDLGRCQKMNPAGTACVKWTTYLDNNYPDAYANLDADTPEPFNIADYRSRYTVDVGGVPTQKTIYSGAWDYSGYSLPNQYPVEVLAEETVGDNVFQLAYPDAPSDTPPAADSLECRGYPEQDSPFSRGSIQERSDYAQPVNFGQSSRLRSLNLCEESGENCQCSYKRVDALDQTVFLPKASQRALPADTREISSHEGWYGYCLEPVRGSNGEVVRGPDGTPVCLAWWPVDVVQGKPNIFENHPEAGFVSSQPLYYCLEAAGNRISQQTAKDASGNEIDTDPAIDGVQTQTAGEYYHIIETGMDNSLYSFSLGDENLGSYLGNYKGFADNFLYPTSLGSSLQLRLIVDADEHGAFKGWDDQFKAVFKARQGSPLSQLHEYDIDSIVLKVHDRDGRNWAALNSQFYITRDGTAVSQLGEVSTPDRWSTFWCGGEADNKCDFTDTYSWKLFEPFFSGGKCAPGEGAIDDHETTNLFGIRALFANEDGIVENELFNNTEFLFDQTGLVEYEPHQFVGLEVGLCDNTGGNGWIEMFPIFKLREWCTDVVQVVDALGENKAWSGRVNNQPQVESPGFSITGIVGSLTRLYRTLNPDGTFVLDNDGNPKPAPFIFNQDSKPYGAIVPPTDTIYTPQDWDSRLDEVEDEFTGEKREGESGKQPLYVEAPKDQVRAGSPYSCSDAEECLFPPSSDRKVSALFGVGGVEAPHAYAIAQLRNIFAKVFGWWKWNPLMGWSRYEKLDPSPTNEVREVGLDWGGGSSAGQCPVIQAVLRDERGIYGQAQPFSDSTANPEQYNRLLTGTNCGFAGTAGAESFGRYSINGISVAHTDGIPIPVSTTNVYVGEEVELSFYGFNYNGEQLPIKKVTIDWVGDGTVQGDGTIIGGTDVTVVTGNFKNHWYDCGEAMDNFGQKPRSCDRAPFVFTHVYQKPGSASPIVIVEDNWGRKTRASYNRSTPILQIKHLNLDIPPPDEVSVSPSTTPNQGQSVVFSWTSPQETATFFLSDITEYEISVKKNFSNGSSVADPSGDRQEKNDRSFSIDGDQNLKSVLFQVRTCTDEGCGAPASELITFTPDGISAALDPIPLVRGIPTVISWTANAIADTYEIELDEKDDVVASSAVITAPNLEWTYEYEPNTNHVRIHVRPCNGAVCGEYLSSPRLTYQEYIGIISGTGQTEVSTGSAFSRVITLNKSSNYTYSFSPARPAWLSAIHSGSTITLSGTPQLADAGTFSSTITVNYTEAPVSSATGSIIVVVNSTCGDGIVQLSIGEQCDPNSTATPMPNQNAIANYTINGVIADNSITKRCVPAGQTIGGRTECNWWPDADSDGIDGQTDCQNHVNDPNMFIGSTHQGTASGDYNCSGVIDSDLSCSAYDYQDLRTNWGSHPSAAGEHNSCETPCTAPGEEYCIASYASMTSACDTFDGTYDYSPAPGGACSGSNRGSPPGPSGYGWEYGLLCRACTASQTLYW